MPAVDLTVILPALDEALKPFQSINDLLAKQPVNAPLSPRTPLRTLLPFPPPIGPTLGDWQKLMQSIDAIKRLAAG